MGTLCLSARSRLATQNLSWRALLVITKNDAHTSNYDVYFVEKNKASSLTNFVIREKHPVILQNDNASLHTAKISKSASQ